MIIHDVTGNYDDEREYTAGELCGDHWWVNREYRARVVGGRAEWETAANSGGRLVRLQRLDGRRGCALTRYVDPDTRMVLVRTQWTNTEPDQ